MGRWAVVWVRGEGRGGEGGVYVVCDLRSSLVRRVEMYIC